MEEHVVEPAEPYQEEPSHKEPISIVGTLFKSVNPTRFIILARGRMAIEVNVKNIVNHEPLENDHLEKIRCISILPDSIIKIISFSSYELYSKHSNYDNFCDTKISRYDTQEATPFIFATPHLAPRWAEIQESPAKSSPWLDSPSAHF